MKKVTCCNIDGVLNLKHIHSLDDYIDENEDIEIVLTDKVPYLDRDEGINYMSSEDASKYLNRGGRNLKITVLGDSPWNLKTNYYL